MLKTAGLIALGIIPVLLGMSFASSAYAEIRGYSETQVIVKSSQQHCLQYEIKAVAMGFRDVNGNTIRQAATGSHVSVQTIINNDCDIADYPATILLEVRDSEGMTKYLALQQIVLEPGHHPRVGFSWTPDKPGDYEVRVFTITSINSTVPFNPILTHKISVY
ncbi:MAG: hypothetical protein ABI348_04115 [Nitrososphaera sp.]